jgi:hypothetical protein
MAAKLHDILNWIGAMTRDIAVELGLEARSPLRHASSLTALRDPSSI